MLRSAAFSIALAGALAGCAGGTQSLNPAAADCSRFDLEPRPSWLFSGEWVNEGTRPGTISRTQRGLVVLDRADRLVSLQDDFRAAWEVTLRDVHFAGGDRVGYFLSFIEAGGDFVGFTTLVDEDRRAKWWGIARLRLGEPPAVERLYALPPTSTAEGESLPLA